MYYLACVAKISGSMTVRPTLIYLNPVKVKYYSFMVGLDKYSGNCNVLSPKLCVSKERKDINIKVFNMITNKNGAITMAKHISCDYECKFNSTTCNSDQKWNNKTCQCKYKNYRKCKKDYSWSPSICSCENSKYLKGVGDTSAIACSKIMLWILYQQKWQML